MDPLTWCTLFGLWRMVVSARQPKPARHVPLQGLQYVFTEQWIFSLGLSMRNACEALHPTYF